MEEFANFLTRLVIAYMAVAAMTYAIICLCAGIREELNKRNKRRDKK